jgi:hypothetical protein
MVVLTPELIVGVLIVIAVPTVIGQVRSAVVWAVQLKRADIAKRSMPAPDISCQLELLQQSVDAMAIEVERISEWQRAGALQLPVVLRKIEATGSIT